MIPWQPGKIVKLTKADDYTYAGNIVISSVDGKEWCHDLAASFRATVPPRDLKSQQHDFYLVNVSDMEQKKMYVTLLLPR